MIPMAITITMTEIWYHDCQYEGSTADVSSWTTFVNLVSGNTHDDGSSLFDECWLIFWWIAGQTVEAYILGLTRILSVDLKYLQVVMQDKTEFEVERLRLTLLWPDLGLKYSMRPCELEKAVKPSGSDSSWITPIELWTIFYLGVKWIFWGEHFTE